MLAIAGLYLNHVAVAALFSVLVTGTLGSPVVGPEPIRCAPCTPERLSQCPAVAPECTEALREPGCGCCLACALKAGELCGIYTARCGSGLRCIPRPGDARPLHSLTRGQAVCTESTEPEATPEPQIQGKAYHIHINHQCSTSSQQTLKIEIIKKNKHFSVRSETFYSRSQLVPLLIHSPSYSRSGRARAAGDGQRSHHLGPQLQPLPPRSRQALRPAGCRRRSGEHESQTHRRPQETGGAGWSWISISVL